LKLHSVVHPVQLALFQFSRRTVSGATTRWRVRRAPEFRLADNCATFLQLELKLVMKHSKWLWETSIRWQTEMCSVSFRPARGSYSAFP